MFVAISIASYYDSYGNSCCLHPPEARPLSPWSRLGGCEAILGLTMTCFLGHTTRLISGGNSRYVVWQKSQAWEPQILVLMQANHTVNYSIFGNLILTHVTMSFDNFFWLTITQSKADIINGFGAETLVTLAQTVQTYPETNKRKDSFKSFQRIKPVQHSGSLEVFSDAQDVSRSFTIISIEFSQFLASRCCIPNALGPIPWRNRPEV